MKKALIIILCQLFSLSAFAKNWQSVCSKAKNEGIASEFIEAQLGGNSVPEYWGKCLAKKEFNWISIAPNRDKNDNGIKPFPVKRNGLKGKTYRITKVKDLNPYQVEVQFEYLMKEKGKFKPTKDRLVFTKNKGENLSFGCASLLHPPQNVLLAEGC